MRPFDSVLERLESPFLNEEVLPAGPSALLAGEDGEDYETPPVGPTTPSDFLRGRVWSFTAAALPLRVAIFSPKAVSPKKELDILVYVHGDLPPCTPVPKVPEDLITKKPFELGKIVDASQRQILLVVPFMDWPNLKKNKLNFEACNRETMHALGVPGNLNGVLKEVLAEVARVSGKTPFINNLILAGHSRAHAFFNALALLHIDPEMRKGVLASLKELWCLDSTYFAFMAEWIRWLKSNINLRAEVFFIAGTGTAAWGRKFEAASSSLGGGKLVVTRVKEGHCKVPGTRLPALLNPSMTQVTPEISEEEEYQDEAMHDEQEADEADETDGETSEWSDQAREFEALAEEGEEAEEEIVGGSDERKQVGNPFVVPNRWVCAIDIQTDNPDYPSKGGKYLIKSRGTGILIGPRYVLTARHVVGNLAGTATSPNKGLLVSPARNGDNASNPLGKISQASVRGAGIYRVQQTIRGRVHSVPRRDDYALIILSSDVSSKKHSKITGTLGFWGENQKVATIKVLATADIDKQDVTVVGYPGDTCGSDKFSGSKTSVKNKIDNCWNFRNDEWASKQWTCPGTASVDPDPAVIFHTADTHEGQSGGPIYLSIGNTLHLAGIHTAPDNAHRNRGVRITTRMLQELADWINADWGSTIASVHNDTLLVQPPATGTTKELVEPDREDQEDQEDDYGEDRYVGVVDEQEDREDYEDFGNDDEQETPVEEQFDPNALPDSVKAARDKKDWPLTLKLAIESGIRSENDLTNIVFFALHPELPPEPLKPKEAGKRDKEFEKLSAEWIDILKKHVKPAIYKASTNSSLKVSGSYVAERDPMFSGNKGQEFKTLIEEVSKEADINPGFLSAVLLAEWDRRDLYLSKGEVLSFDTGTDDFFEQRHQLKDKVPAFAKIRFDEKRKTTNTNEHGRVVTTVPFETGKDAALASAVYLKAAEIKLRAGAAKNGGDFDALPVETRFALMRIAMAAGHGGITPDGDFVFFKRKNGKWVRAKKGEKGATLLGVASRLNRVLKGRDILVRKNEPRKDPTDNGHVTNRNATILSAQAMHLSDWIFGIPLETKTQPETDWTNETEQPDLERNADEEYASTGSF